MGRLDSVTERFNRAVDRLAAASELRQTNAKEHHALKREMETLQQERTRLLAELDTARAQARHYSSLVDDVSGRLDAAIDELRDVLGVGTGAA
jgi:chromosome segregation ATPase